LPPTKTFGIVHTLVAVGAVWRCPLFGERMWLVGDENDPNDPNRSCIGLPTTGRLHGPRCWLTVSGRYDMLMSLVEENGVIGMSPNCGGETDAATQIKEIGG
jgi:hypothetical protein